MQTLVAKDLNMERGKCSSIVEAQRIGVEVEQSRKRINIKEYKVQKRKENELKKDVCYAPLSYHSECNTITNAHSISKSKHLKLMILEN